MPLQAQCSRNDDTKSEADSRTAPSTWAEMHHSRTGRAPEAGCVYEAPIPPEGFLLSKAYLYFSDDAHEDQRVSRSALNGVRGVRYVAIKLVPRVLDVLLSFAMNP